MKKSFWLLFISLFVTTFILLGIDQRAFALNNFVITNITTSGTGNMLVLNGKNNDGKNDLKVLQLDNPPRYLIDVPNAILVGKKRSFNISIKGIKLVKIGQFSTNPNIVRIVLTSENKDKIDKIEVRGSKDNLVFRLNYTKPEAHSIANQHETFSTAIDKMGTETLTLRPKKILPKISSLHTNSSVKRESVKNQNDESSSLQTHLNIKQKFASIAVKQETPIPSHYNEPNINIITAIKLENNNIILSGAGNIELKEPFNLKKPSRIIFDLP